MVKINVAYQQKPDALTSSRFLITPTLKNHKIFCNVSSIANSKRILLFYTYRGVDKWWPTYVRNIWVIIGFSRGYL